MPAQARFACALPAIEAPSEVESWPRYEMISGAFSFAYPPALSVESEDAYSVVLDEGGLYGASLVISMPDAVQDIDLAASEEAVRSLKLLLTSDENWKHRFFDGGELGARTPGIYVSGMWGEYGDDFEIEFAAALAQVGGDIVRVHYMRYGSPDITGEAVPILRAVIDSIQVP